MDFSVFGSAEKKAIVFDLGSAFIKCGFAGEGSPRHVIKSSFSAEYERCPPVSKAEWIEILGVLFSNLYFRYLQAKPKERRVLICEHLLAPAAFREAAAYVLFEQLKVPSILFSPCEILALYTTGLSTGIVIDSGRNHTRILPVYQGMALQSSYQSIPLGALSVVGSLRNFVVKQAGASNAAFDDETLQDIVVRTCFVLPMGSQATVSAVQFPLSAAEAFVVGGPLRTQSAEVFFKGDDDEGTSLTAAVLDTILSCPMDVRPAVVQNVLVVGGGTMLPGFCARLAEELAAEAKRNPRYHSLAPLLEAKLQFAKVCFPRNMLSWAGASLVGGTEVLSQLSMTGEAYAKSDGHLNDWTVSTSRAKEEQASGSQQEGGEADAETAGVRLYSRFSRSAAQNEQQFRPRGYEATASFWTECSAKQAVAK
jgi:actin-related protein 10